MALDIQTHQLQSDVRSLAGMNEGASHAGPIASLVRRVEDALSLDAALTTTATLRPGAATPYRRHADSRDASPIVMKSAPVVLASPVAITLLIGAALGSEGNQDAINVVNTGRLPVLAQRLLPDLEALRTHECPQLPLVWLLADVQVESGWNPRAYSTAGAAGLTQMLPTTWTAATGGQGWDVVAGPPADHPVWAPMAHMAAAVPWMCANLRKVVVALMRTRKPTTPLDALAVCHIAGCSRVTGSATGVPKAGEAGCGNVCAGQVRAYLAAIHTWIELLTRSAPEGVPTGRTAAPFPGGATGCSMPDPTGTGGCVTAATAWLLGQAEDSFPGVPAACWDRHAWNPSSDHPLGRACDFTFGHLGQFPDARDTARGWSMAAWVRRNAGALRVTYIIWQGRIWSASRAAAGWRAYTGGGVYDPTDPTGGHYDHVHVSVAM